MPGTLFIIIAVDIPDFQYRMFHNLSRLSIVVFLQMLMSAEHPKVLFLLPIIMDFYFDNIVYSIDSVLTFIRYQIQVRSAAEWFFFFMPFYIFGEFPRYVLPVFFLLISRLAGWDRDDTEKRKAFLKNRPTVSVLLVGYNEEETVTKAIDSLLELEYENMEIIVVDDNSADEMYKAALPYSEKGLIKLFKNTAAGGRSGRPSSSNMALHLSTGEYILSVDADTSFDRDILLHMIGPFYDARVGGVAGNLKVRNTGESVWARFQAIEYTISIGLWKRWLNLIGMNMQASGAFGAFRRKVLLDTGAWDPELAEDADLSLKVKKAGWKIVFAPEAIAMTNAPTTRKALTNQRFRWDMSGFRTYFRKHADILKFWQYDWRNCFEVSLEFFFSIVMTMVYAAYIGYMLVFFPFILIFVWSVTYGVYMLTTLAAFGVHLIFSERIRDEWPLVFTIPFFPLYKGYTRWVRFFSVMMELFRVNYEDPYLPVSAWRNTRKW